MFTEPQFVVKDRSPEVPVAELCGRRRIVVAVIVALLIGLVAAAHNAWIGSSADSLTLSGIAAGASTRRWPAGQVVESGYTLRDLARSLDAGDGAGSDLQQLDLQFGPSGIQQDQVRQVLVIPARVLR